MAIVLAVVVVLLVAILAVVAALVSEVDQNNKAIAGLHELVLSQERDRRYAKCSGLFARVFRALDMNGKFGYTRITPEIMKLDFNGAIITVAVEPGHGSFETGQIIAYGDTYQTIHSCEADIRAFGRQIRQAVERLNGCRTA